MKNMFQMIRNASVMQRQLKKIQSRLRERTVDFTSGGKVTATVRGDMSLAAIRIDPSIIDPAQAAGLEKMVVAAVEGALAAAKEMSAQEMKQQASAMGLPDIPGMGV
ncbi:MAG: YbaB/EbfC family nucleoid-associated protein [Lentisphaerae bacterium]|nr:YbaB/EbfC family nucleoid-associated protein [Lentisphaerota bacterium]